MADADLAARMKRAAQLVKENAASRASWSSRIPASLRLVAVGDDAIYVQTTEAIAPDAPAYELGKRHPLNWPNQKQWGPTPHRPFLAPAAEATANAVAEEIANVVDDYCKGDW